jgi:hypothetical protein
MTVARDERTNGSRNSHRGLTRLLLFDVPCHPDVPAPTCAGVPSQEAFLNGSDIEGSSIIYLWVSSERPTYSTPFDRCAAGALPGYGTYGPWKRSHQTDSDNGWTPYPLEAKPATHRARHKDIVFENSGQRGNGAPAGAVPGDNLLQPEGLKIIDGFRNDRFGT